MRTLVVFFAAVVLLAGGAAWSTRILLDRQSDPSHDTMHRWLHDKLDLTPAQVDGLNQLELRFVEDEERLRSRLREANRELGRTLMEEKGFTPRVERTVEQVHHWMGELQKLSIAHLFEMQQHLTPEQNEKLLHLAEMALTDTP